MNAEKFFYITYIAATPEEVWAALIEPEFTRQYWRHENVSDWKVGSRWEHTRSDGETGKVDVVGKVVEVRAPRRLVMTWARPSEPAETARYSRVMFDLETVGASVKLTVTHDELDADMARSISTGWPMVLSNLKSLLETGRPLVNLW